MAGTRGIPCDVVPAPAESDARCDLALVTVPDRAEALTAALQDEGVPHGRWPPTDADPAADVGRPTPSAEGA